MYLHSSAHWLYFLSMKKKLLCLDVGAKVIGVAVADAGGSVAFPRDEIAWLGQPETLRQALVALREAEMGEFALVVLGQPRDPSSSMIEATRAVEAILGALEWPYEVADEHVSTQEAANRIADIEEETGVTYAKARRDSVAAQIILERYLAHA